MLKGLFVPFLNFENKKEKKFVVRLKMIELNHLTIGVSKRGGKVKRIYPTA